MRKGSADVLHLSVRQERELARELKKKEQAEARIAALEQLGSKSLTKLCNESAKTIAKFIKATLEENHIPSTLIRKTTAKAVHMAIPKSPRGRKPAEHQEAA